MKPRRRAFNDAHTQWFISRTRTRTTYPLRWINFKKLGVSFSEVSIHFEQDIPDNTVEIYLYQTPVDTLILAPDEIMIMASLETVNLPGQVAHIQERYTLSFLTARTSIVFRRE